MEKRFFLAFEVEAPWQEEPPGRYIKHRHLTIAFLGNVETSKIENILKNFEAPNFKVGPSGIFDKLLFLPKFLPRVVSYNIDWLSDKRVSEYRETVLEFLKKMISL